MGATSVTGISGPGTVAGSQKGSEHMSLGVKKLIGPKISAAGKVTLSGTTGVVQLPNLGSLDDYMVMVSANSSTLAYVSTAMAAVANSDMWDFTVTGGNNAVVNWAVVKIGS